jgi:nicotinamidase-related amidase
MEKFDLNKTALLIMDVQNDIVHENGKYKDFGSPAHAKERNIFAHIKKVLDKAREVGLKVVYVKFGMRDFKSELKGNHTPILDAVGSLKACDLNTWGGDVHESIKPIAREDIVEKNRINAFHNTNLKQILDKANIDTLILTGVATNYVVEATARYASDDDYRVIVLEDCCSSMNQGMHDFSIKNILSNVGEISTSDEVVGMI